MSTVELLVFARLPQLGRVKTRLAASLGDSAALRIYERLLAHVLSQVCAPDRPWTVTVSSTPADEASLALMRTWLRDHGCMVDRVVGQIDSDLGGRMQHAIRSSLAQGVNRNAIVIGTDCPTINSATIEQAVNALDRVDCVLGPAQDGGYYLIGTSRADLPVFSQIEWSTERVFSQTCEHLTRASVSWATLDTMADIDTAQDWEHARLLLPEPL
jgi:rSAM/selenodomain-associated transferase 1